MLNLGPRSASRARDFLASGRKVGHRFAHARVFAAGLASASSSVAGMHCDRSGGIDTLSIGMPVRVRKVIAAVSRSSCAWVTLGARGLQALLGLLLVGDADRALGDAFAKVAGELLVEGHIVLGDRDQPLLEQIIDVGPRSVERDEFGTLLDARRGGIGAGRLAADLGLAAAAVVDQLIDDQVALDRPQGVVGDAEACAGSGCAGRERRPSLRPRCADSRGPAPEALPR